MTLIYILEIFQMFYRQLKQVRDVQNAINEHDFVRKVLPHIARRNDNIVREVLAIISGMLLNANRDVQVGIIQRRFISFAYDRFTVIASAKIKEENTKMTIPR